MKLPTKSNLQATLTICDMKQLMKMQVFIIALAPTSLFAHEGHGHIPGSHPLHYMAEPFHVLVFLVAVSAIAGLAYHLRKRKAKS
jgi:hypothetical protein